MKRRPRSRTHLEIGTILDFLENRLDEGARKKMEEHLGEPCEACRDLLHESGLILERMRLDRGTEVPEAWRRRALELFAPSTEPARRASLRTLVARLLFDTAASPSLATTRGTVGSGRRMTFALGEGTLEVESEPEGPGVVSIRGVLRLEEPALHEIRLESGGDHRAVFPDAEGRFALGSIPSARIAIVVAGPAGRWRVPPFSPR